DYTEPVDGLSVGARATNAIRLNWKANAKAEGYLIEQYKSGKWKQIAKITDKTTVTYRVTKLSASTGYEFRIRAYRTDGEETYYSEYTSIDTATTLNKVTGLAIGARSSSAIRLNWNADKSVDGYVLEQYNGSKWVQIKKLASNTEATWKVTKLKAKTSYQFRIRAYKTIGGKVYYSAYTTITAKTN
ncbi:MAG: fibronectin type III domain-containing protein, partial [Lachnospiraceae bacterium]|nr:fibronectin type III domain-containing protein [Lachnospiraceae bacterium]